MTDTQTNHPRSRGHRSSRKAGLIVTVVSACFVLGLIALLFHHSNQIKPTAQALLVPDAMISACDSVSCREALVEQEVQRFRAMRVESAMLYRNEVYVATIIVSLAMVVLGSVLIFDRVTSLQPGVAGLDNGQYRAVLASTFPGLMLGVAGAAVLALNSFFVAYGNTGITVREGRVLKDTIKPAIWTPELIQTSED